MVLDRRKGEPRERPTPHPQKLPIAPIFIADSVSIHVSHEKGGKLRIVYAGWDDAKVLQPDEVPKVAADAP